MYKLPSKFIPANSKVVVYGAGNVGRDYMDQLINDDRYTVVSIVDRNSNIKSLHGIPVMLPYDIKSMDYDYIIIAVDSLSVSIEISNTLIAYGVDSMKIIYPAVEFFEERIATLGRINGQLVLSNIGGRLDKRLIRLEILQYYSIKENFERLDEEQLEILKQVQNYCEDEFRVFPEDKYYLDDKCKIPEMYTEKNLFYDEMGYYCIIDGTKLYFGRNKELAIGMLKGFYVHYEKDNPHRYLCKSEDGMDIISGDIIADIGACEGFFGIKYIKKSSKVYFFEGEHEWIIQLRKSILDCDNAEIVEGYVGDEKDCIKLDEYFSDKDYPSVIKIDVEGMELAVLRGAENILAGNQRLLLLIATYHRQEDWDRIEKLLNPDKGNPRFKISHSKGYYWHIPDPRPPYFRRGIMRAERIL